MFPVIDLFAGPGGLNEGFSSVRDAQGSYAFQTMASFEMDAYACRTLQLRETFRHLTRSGRDLNSYYSYIRGEKSWPDALQGEFRDAYETAKERVYEVELGPSNRPRVDEFIELQLGAGENRQPWALIGGPPCQAYSLAGRSRRKGDKTFATDHKHFLYREYLHILAKFRPTVFVMENVKGLLSSRNGSSGMFDTILQDLSNLPGNVSYEIRSLVVDADPDDLLPADFVIRAEEYGIPQRRHRVILLGVRSDVAKDVPRRVLSPADGPVTVRSVLQTMPAVMAATSRRRPRTNADWESVLQEALRELERLEMLPPTEPNKTGKLALDSYEAWILDSAVQMPIQHDPRSHMVSDLARYRVMAQLAERIGKSPKYTDLPSILHPEHRNVADERTPFTDRFRVQVWDAPSTTVVSHISKDGHYYIHPDADQARSFTVREAARLQTFPDNYFFEGPRTQQFHQVGNAVPPLLARQIGEVVAEMLASLQR